MTITDKEGKWMLEFPPMDYGDMVVLRGFGERDTAELKNVLIGDCGFVPIV